MDKVEKGLNSLSLKGLIWIGTVTPAFNKLTEAEQLKLIEDANELYPKERD